MYIAINVCIEIHPPRAINVKLLQLAFIHPGCLEKKLRVSADFHLKLRPPGLYITTFPTNTLSSTSGVCILSFC